MGVCARVYTCSYNVSVRLSAFSRACVCVCVRLFLTVSAAHPEAVFFCGVRPHYVGRNLRRAMSSGVLTALCSSSQIGEGPELHCCCCAHGDRRREMGEVVLVERGDRGEVKMLEETLETGV